MTLRNRLFRCLPRVLALVLVAAGLLPGMGQAQVTPFTVDITMSSATAAGFLPKGRASIQATFSTTVDSSLPPRIAIVRDSVTNGNSLSPTAMAPASPTSSAVFTALWDIEADNGVDIRDGPANVLLWDGLGNPITSITTGSHFTVDTTSPRVNLQVSPSGAVIGGRTVDVTATFNDLTSTRILGSPRLSLVRTDGQTEPLTDVAVTAMTTAPTDAWSFIGRLNLEQGRRGAARFQIVGATDQAGNPNQQPSDLQSRVQVDTTPPTAIAPPELPGHPNRVVPAGQSVLQLTFSKPLGVAPTVTITPTSGQAGLVPAVSTMVGLAGGRTWQAAFNVSSSITTRTTVSVTVTGGVDSIGNSMTLTAWPAAFWVDPVSPRVSRVNFSPKVAPAGPLVITAGYDEVLSSAPSISIDRRPVGLSAGDIPLAIMSPTASGTTWTYVHDVIPSVSGGPQDGAANVVLSGGTDQAGNPSTAYTTHFDVDTARPTVTFGVAQGGRTYSASGPALSTGPVTITLSFNEVLSASPTVVYTRSAGSPVTTSAHAVVGYPSLYTATWTLEPADGLTVFDGAVEVAVQGAVDLAGNPVAPPATTSFLVDTAAPTMCLTWSRGATFTCGSTSGTPSVTAGPLLVTATFSEPVFSVPALDFFTVGACLVGQRGVPMTRGADSSIWTAAFEIAPGCNSSPAGDPVTLTASGARDAAGNTVPPASVRFLVDDRRPSLATLTFGAQGRDAPAGYWPITASFTEPLIAPPVISIDRPPATAGAGDVAMVPMSPTASPLTWTYLYLVEAASSGRAGDGLANVVVSGAIGATGPMPGVATGQFVIDTTPPSVAFSYSWAEASGLTRYGPTRNANLAAVRDGFLDVTATFTEPPPTTPTIVSTRSGAAPVSLPLAFSDSVTYVSSIRIVETDAGTWQLSVTAPDRAGNEAQVLAPSTYTVTAARSPTVSFSFTRADAAGTARSGSAHPVDLDFVRAGFLDLTATFSEPMSTTPAVSHGRVGNTPIELALSRADDSTFVGAILLTSLDSGTNQLYVTAADPGGIPAVIVGRSTFFVDSTAPREASFTLFPARPVGASLTPTVVGQRDPSTPPVALSSGPVTVVVTFNEPIAVTSSVVGLVPSPLTPTIELVRPRDGFGSTATATTRWPLVPTVPAGSLAATVWTTVIAVPGRGLPEYEDGYSTWTLTSGIDRAGNSFTTRVHEAVIDTQPPVLSVPEPSGTLTADNGVRVAGSAADLTGATVQLTLLGSALSATQSVTRLLPGFDLTVGPLPFLPPSDLSGLQLLLRATDLAGNVATLRVGGLTVDTDGDGLPDDFEARATQQRDGVASITGLTPGGDDDGDGLTNLQEYLAGTDPELADTDDDGVDDATELAASGQANTASNPLDPSDARPVARLVRAPPSVPMAPQIVALDGRVSSDPRSRALGYRWSVAAAPAGAAGNPFLGTSDRSPVGYARLSTPGAYSLVLTVGNGSTFRSPPSTMASLVIEDVAPRASVGASLVFEAPSLPMMTRLDGSASADDNGQVLTYAWRLTANPAGGASLTADVAGPTPLVRVTAPGSYSAELTVTSGGGGTSVARSSVATCWIVVHGPVDPATGSIPAGAGSYAPVARAGADQRRVTTAPVSYVDVTLFGHGSIDPQNPTLDPLRPSLDFFWTQLAGPAAATLLPDARGLSAGSAASSVDPRARLTVPGRYTFGLSVRRAGHAEPAGASDSVTVEWSRLDASTGYGPAAEAGLDRTVNGFDAAAPPIVELNGTASRPSPQTGGSLVYRWSQVRQGPFDSTPEAALDNPASPRPVLVPPAPGDYRFELTVTDVNRVVSLPDSVLVQVRTLQSRAGISASGRAYGATSFTLSYSRPARIETAAGPLVTLDASGSGGVGALTYRWRQLFEHSPAAPVALSPVAGNPARVTFRPVVSGNYRFGVTVSDGSLSAEAELIVPVDDWRAGRNAGVTPHVSYSALVATAADRLTLVTLDASASFDRDRNVSGRYGYPVFYSWRQVGGPALLDFDRSAAKPGLALPANAQGTFTFELTVDDLQDSVLVEGISFEARPSSSTSAATAGDLGSGGGEGGSFGGCSLAGPGGGATPADLLVMMMALGWLAWPLRRRGDRGELR